MRYNPDHCKRLKQIVEPLLLWYRKDHRQLPWRDNPSPYRVWVSEIMLQQTRVEAVIPYYERFLAACPTVRDLAALDEQKLLKLWEGLGYYSRARNLHKAAQTVCAVHGGVFPNEYAALRALPGVGDYTAGAVGSIAFGLPVPAVDGNVLRVIARLTDDSRPIDDAKVKKEITAQVQAILPAGRSGEFNQALMELGATVCLPNGAPHCAVCPVAHLCEAYRKGTARSLPVRAPKKKRRIEPRTVLVLHCAGRFGLRRRPDEGLLAGLWELPAYEGALPPDAVRAALAEDGFAVREVLSLRPEKHIFSHIEWHMTGYYVELDALKDGLTWATPAELHGRYALPSAFRAFRAVMEGGENDGL